MKHGQKLKKQPVTISWHNITWIWVILILFHLSACSPSDNDEEELQEPVKEVAKKITLPTDAESNTKSNSESKKIAIILTGGGTFSNGSNKNHLTNYPRFFQYGLNYWYTSIFKLKFNPNNVFYAYTDGTNQNTESYNINPQYSYFSTLELPEFSETNDLISQFKDALKTWDGEFSTVDTSFLQQQITGYDSFNNSAVSQGILEKQNYSGSKFYFNNQLYQSPIPIVTHSNSLNDIDTIFDNVLEIVSAEEGYTVYVYVIAHGTPKIPTIRVFSEPNEDGYLTMSYLSEAFSQIGPHAPIFATISSCFSGQFLELSELDNVVVSSSATHDSVAMFKSGVGQKGAVDDLTLTEDYLADVIDHYASIYLKDFEVDSRLIDEEVDTFLEHYLITHYRAIENITWNTLDYLVKNFIDENSDQKHFYQYYLNNFATEEEELESLSSEFSLSDLESQISGLESTMEELLETSSDTDENSNNNSNSNNNNNDDNIENQLQIIDFIKGEVELTKYQIEENSDLFEQHPSEKYLDFSRFAFNKAMIEKIINYPTLSVICKNELTEQENIITISVFNACESDVYKSNVISSTEKNIFNSNQTLLRWSSLIRLRHHYNVIRLYDYLYFVEKASSSEINQFLKKLTLMKTVL